MTLIRLLPQIPPIFDTTSQFPTDVPTGSLSSSVTPLGLFIFNGSGWTEIGGGTGAVTSLTGSANQILFNGVTTPQTGAVTATLASTVVIGGGVVDSKSVLTLNSTTLGFLPPRMTTTQKNAITSPTSGLTLYDSTLNDLQFYNGSTWISSAGTTSIIGTNLQVLANGTSGSSQSGTVTLTLPSTVRISTALGIMTSGTPSYEIDVVQSKTGTQTIIHVQNSSSGAASDALFYAQTTNGDPYLLLQAASTSWTAGLDISDSTKFKIGNAGAVGTNDMFVMASSTFTANILTLSGSHYGALKTSGTVTQQDGSSLQYGTYHNNTFTPAANTATSSNLYCLSTAAVGGGITVTDYVEVLSSTSFVGLAGTLTRYYGIRYDGGTSISGGGSIGNIYGGFFQRPTATGTTSTTALYAADMVIGSAGTNPPSSGLYVATAITIGAAAQASTQITLNPTGQYGIYATATMVGASADLYGIRLNNIYSPTTAFNTYGYAFTGTFNAVSGRTIPSSYAHYSDITTTASGGTLTSVYNYYATGGTNSAAATVTNVYGYYATALAIGTNRWGGYFNAPSAGTIAVALYTANLVVGSYTSSTAVSNGIICSGNVSIGSATTTSLFNVGSSNQFQIDTNGNVGINGIVSGARFAISSTTTASTGNIYQIYAAGSLGASSGTVGTASYIYCYPNYGSNVTTITTACGLLIDSGNSTGTITTGYGIFVNPIAWGTTRYALWVSAPTGGTTNYGAFIGGASGFNVAPSTAATLNIAGLGSAGVFGINISGTISKVGTTIYGINSSPTLVPENSSYNAYGFVSNPTVTCGASNVNAMFGAYISSDVSGSGTLSEARMLSVGPGSTSGVTVTTTYGIKQEALAVGTTRIALFVATPSGGSNVCGAFLGYPVNIGDSIQYEASKITCYINRNTHTSASSDTYQLYVAGSMGATTSNTIGRSCVLYLNPDLSANAGTVSDAFGILIGVGNTAGTVTRGYGMYIAAIGYGSTRTGLRVDTPTGGASNVCAFFQGPIQFNTSSTGAKTVTLGTNAPAAVGTLTPNTWIQIITPAGNTAFIPCWV